MANKRVKMKKLKQQTKTCSTCEGKGAYEDHYDDMYGGTHYLGVFECWRCEGTGVVNLGDELKSDQRVQKIINNLFKNENKKKRGK